MLLLLSLMVSAAYGTILTSDSGTYCADDSLRYSWFDAEVWCNENFGGFSSYHSEEEWQELRALSLRMGSGFNWNGAYEEEGTFDIIFSDGSPYDHIVATENDAVSSAEYGLCSSNDALYLGINPHYTTNFMCNCEPYGATDDLCPDGCSTISFDGCNKCRCRKAGNTICEDNDCSPTTERTCLYTEVVHTACPEGCARYDLGGRECLCKQKKGYMVCEPEGVLSIDLRPHCIESEEEFEAQFDVQSSQSVNVVSFVSEHWILSSVLSLALIAAVVTFLYRGKLLAKKGEYQPLL